jgi:hypothetical protein
MYLPSSSSVLGPARDQLVCALDHVFLPSVTCLHARLLGCLPDCLRAAEPLHHVHLLETLSASLAPVYAPVFNFTAAFGEGAREALPLVGGGFDLPARPAAGDQGGKPCSRLSKVILSM